MTDISVLNDGICPTCRGEYFIIGPSGGAAVNIKCVMCDSTWWFCPPFTPMAIDPVEGVYTAKPVKLADWMVGP